MNKGLTICIVNDIENNLDRIVKNIKNKVNAIAHEVILINNRKDNSDSKEIPEGIDQIFFCDENISIIEAKYEAFKSANYDWIFILESDEIIQEINEVLIDKLLESNQDSYYLEILNHSNVNSLDITYNISKVRLLNKTSIGLLSKDKDESSLEVKDAKKCEDIKVEKISYLYESDREKRKLKKEKKFAEIHEKIKLNPEDPYGYFLLGLAYKMENDTLKVKESFMKALEHPINTEVAYVQLMIILFGNILLEREEYEEALQLENLYDYFEGIADFLCLMGKIYLKTGFVAEAIREFNKALNTLSCIEPGYNSIIPNYHLGCIYEVMGDIDIAKKLYERCGDYKPAQDRLGVIE